MPPASSVAVARSSQPWALGRNPVGADSIPNVFLIPLDFVLAQQRAQFVLESDFAMMFFLAGDVLLHLLKIRRAHRKICIAALPFEVSIITTAFLQPEVGDAF